MNKKEISEELRRIYSHSAAHALEHELAWLERVLERMLDKKSESRSLHVHITGNFTVTVQPSTPPPSPLVMDPQGGNLPAETVGVSVNDPVCKVSGGQAPYNFSVDAGTLPPGLQLVSEVLADGSEQISVQGSPTQSGAFSFTLTVTDAAGVTASTTVSGGAQ
jgi:hypothetical protein